MKKLIKLVAVALAATALLAACSKKGSDGDKAADGAAGNSKIVIGASNVPHAEILEFVAPKLKEQGVDLEVRTFQDYILPNKTLVGKEIDANFFQHLPYLEKQLADYPDYDLVSIGGVHLEPIGFYSKRHKSLSELPDNALVLGSNNLADRGRVLSAFVQNDLIKLKDGVDTVTANVEDIVDNPKNLKFKLDLEPALTPQVYANDEADVVIINANYALGFGLDPANEPIFVEKSENNPYVNIVAVRTEDKDRPEFAVLIKELQSPATQQFIKDKYKGAVIPAK